MTSPLARVADLAAWLAAAGLDELELSGPDGRVRLVRGGDGTVAAAPPETADGEAAPEVVRSPGVGRFLPTHPLREESLAGTDEPVAAGQTVGLLRVGALLLAVAAPRAGVVARVVAPEGALVGYGDPLVEYWPEET